MNLDFSYLQLSRYLTLKLRKLEIEDPAVTNLKGKNFVNANAITKGPIRTIDNHKRAIDIVNDIYKKLNMTDFSRITTTSSNYTVGDILHFSKAPYFSFHDVAFISCVIANGDSGLVTWPELSNEMLKNVYEVYRPDFKKINVELLESMSKADGEAYLEFKEDKDLIGKIRAKKLISTDGLLQIGDIKFLASPTQISFMTQNGYEYFPTIRTAGNPKIPTLQEVKSVTINLIFPNTDSINNQLLPLLAMYKRTPFVSLYNKDVCEFFSEIKERTSEYIPVALDSISMESVPGFPNTIQCSLNILPFQHKGVGETFQALETFRDVQAQQFYNQDRTLDILEKQLEERLYDKDGLRIDHIKPPRIGHSTNFEESEPFRAFYQAIIAERQFVEDEFGNVVVKTNGKSIPIEEFRPTKEENKLHYYSPTGNQKPITFKYKYISDSVHAFSRRVSQGRLEAEEKIADDARYMMSIVTDVDNPAFSDKLYTALYNRQDFFDNMQSQFQEAGIFIDQLLGTYGIDAKVAPAPRIRGLVDFVIQYASFQFQDISNTVQFAKTAKVIAQDNFEFAPIETIDVMHGINMWVQSNDPNGPPIDSVTLKKAVSLIAKEISINMNRVTSESLNEKWGKFFDYLLNLFIGRHESIIEGHSVPFKTSMIPLSDGVIRIDNRKDIVEGWSLNYANKFVPINLQGFKYPFYQHIGSEDMNLSLRITSLQNKRTEGLKEQFSLLNDRLQNSAKIVLYHAPELITELDPRIQVDIKDNDLGNIFNVFGLRKLVYNNSNISSVPGKPGSWSITTGFTQANLTVRDYQSITEIPNYNEIEDRIVNLISRMEVVDGKVIINNYVLDYDKVKTQLKKVKGSPEIQELISRLESTDTKSAILGDPRKTAIFGGTSENPVRGSDLKSLNMILMDLTFYVDSSAKILEQVEKNNEKRPKQLPPGAIRLYRPGAKQETLGLEEESNADDFNAIKKRLQLFETGIISKTKSASETEEFNLLLKNPTLTLITKNLISRQNELKDTQANILIKMLTEPKGLWATLVNNWNSGTWLALSSAATVGLLGVLLSKTGIGGIIGVPLVKLSGAMFVGTGITTGLETAAILKLEKAKKQLFDQMSNSINTVINGMKYSYVGEMARSIIKDPLIRKKLFGDTYEDSIDKIQRNQYANCYKDFDVPVKYTHIDGEPEIAFSPDFYLYNKDISKLEKLSYAKDSITRMIKIGRISSLLTIKENHETLKKLEKLEHIIFKDTPDEEKSRILSELDIKKNSPAIGGLDENYIKDRLDDLEKLYTAIVLEHKNDIRVLDPDKNKLNLIRSARAKRIIELKLLQSGINTSLIDLTDKKSKAPDTLLTFLDIKKADGSAYDSSLDSVKRIQKHIGLYFEKSFHTTAEIEKSVNKEGSDVERIENPFFKKFVSQPNIRRFEEVVETTLTQTIILSNAIQDYHKGATEFQDLDTIPELAMLGWWNWRNTEDTVHKIGLQKEFLQEDQDKIRGFNSKMFPTFKIYFVEEDSKLLMNLDDYYSYDAIQSIDIVSNKYSAGRTAVIKLSNSIGNLTNKLSLMRERSSIWEQIVQSSDNIFLGTLDIKPGTKIIIKLGYSANDRFLKTKFVGRVIEMNPGPNMELICQSYGTQLNHDIVKMNFGILSTDKEHGDIASVVLDAVPSLEGLGKPALLGLNAARFSGKNLKGIDKNLFEQFLLSNITSRVNAGMFAQDNPRDDNIYLPYNMIRSLGHNPTFDWRVYNQTVWQSLSEISLYHRNIFPIVKLYNDDHLSTLGELRETIVLGDKAGYYKNTDSFSLSTMSIKEVEEAVSTWNKSGGVRESLLVLTENVHEHLRKDYDKVEYRSSNTAYPLRELAIVLEFFRNRRNATVIMYKLLKEIDYPLPMNIGNITLEYLRNTLPGVLDPKEIQLLSNIMKVSSMGALSNNEVKDTPVITLNVAPISPDTRGLSTTGTVDPIFNLIRSFRSSNSFIMQNGPLYDLITEDFLHVEPFESDNTASKFINDPRYTKIQKHHLITDQSDIISNNIVLSQDFANAVSLYYLWEPKFYDSLTGIKEKDLEGLQSFTIKAFGDQRDKDVRLLETYQKNIDTNIWDIRDKSAQMLNSYFKVQDKKLRTESADWDKLPSFVVVALSLLQREVEKMYRGTITVVGNPNIEPMDILHIEDYINDMHGPVEVEEVVLSISPDRGFTTTITPSLITYDRDPRIGADIEVVQRIMKTANEKRRGERIVAGLTAAGLTGGILATKGGLGMISKSSLFKKILGTAGTTLTIATLVASLWRGTIAAEKKYAKFLYDSMANVFGRDCINFSALYYHGSPYMCGFNGVDYTSIKTLINHQIKGMPLVTRLAASGDPERVWIANKGNLNDMTTKEKLALILFPGGNFATDAFFELGF